MTDTAAVRLLVSQLCALQRAHRAGITPQYGELEHLFETTDVVERQLIAASETPAIGAPCDVPGCGKPSVRLTTDGRKLCIDCTARVIAAVLVGDKAPLSALELIQR